MATTPYLRIRVRNYDCNWWQTNGEVEEEEEVGKINKDGAE